MKFLLAVSITLFSAFLYASEPFDLKGDPLGMDLSNFKSKHLRETTGKNDIPFCSDAPHLAGDDILPLLSRAWQPPAGLINCSLALRFEQRNGEHVQTIAGVPQNILIYHFVDNQLWRITGIFKTRDFQKIDAGLTAKYGTPNSSEQEVYQNKMGASFTGQVNTWDNGASSITLTEMAGKIDRASIIYTHHQLALIVAQKTPKPDTSDL